MQMIRNFWTAFRNFATLFSFIINFVLILVLLGVVQQIYMIKNGIAEPLIDGLHSNFVGLDEATIITTIPVDDTITIDFDLTIDQETTVVLTEAVPLSANAAFALPGGGGTINGTVNLNLPIGLALPVQLNMTVPVVQDIPISLSVPVNIPLNQTQLHQPFVNLRDLFDPFVRALDNLPSSWEETPDFAIDATQGEVDILQETEGSRNPWPGHPEAGEEVEPDAVNDDDIDSAVEPSNDVEEQPSSDEVDNMDIRPTATTVPLIQPTAEGQ
jgi:hypothetical protein